MLLSVSRRTDIPAWYADWFFRRLADGFALVPSPHAPHRLYRVPLGPQIVDGIVFWTKNPLPLLLRLGELADYLTVFQITLTGSTGPMWNPPCQTRTQCCSRHFSVSPGHWVPAG